MPCGRPRRCSSAPSVLHGSPASAPTSGRTSASLSTPRSNLPTFPRPGPWSSLGAPGVPDRVHDIHQWLAAREAADIVEGYLVHLLHLVEAAGPAALHGVAGENHVGPIPGGMVLGEIVGFQNVEAGAEAPGLKLGEERRLVDDA